ncbi:MAG TPA: CHAT domain-containing protein, partial [Ktedonobacteraceae bacterium]
MELILSHITPGEIRVTCDQHQSHTFLLWHIPHPDEQMLFHDPVAYGRILYSALFPPASQAHHALMHAADRMLLVAEEADLDAIPWEYLYGPVNAEEQVECFFVTAFPFVRGLPQAQRRCLPVEERTLRIITVASNPLSKEVTRLDVESEWVRLQETIASLPFALTLENTYPPTLLQLRKMVAMQHQSVVHFMGHGTQASNGAALCFEKENGDLDMVQAEQFVECMHHSVMLVTLNACVSAASGETAFSNLASALVRRQVPYALGMRFRIGDDDARTFSRAFYEHLGRGVSVEAALCQARRVLYQARLASGDNPALGSVGVPVLYTSLSTPAGFVSSTPGKPVLREHRPLAALSALPRLDGLFQGRTEDVKQIGTYLTGSTIPPVLTIHGGIGIGKTALACEALQRFAFAWPGGIHIVALAHLPDFALFVHNLASFLDVDTQVTGHPAVTRDLVLARLSGRRLLLVLDGAETLSAGINEKQTDALILAQFLQQLIGPPVHILATSRLPLGWSGEIVHELSGLTPDEGADCFRQSAPQRLRDIDQSTAGKLSTQVAGSPLSLRLLGGLFNASVINLPAFLEENARRLETIADLEPGHAVSCAFQASIQALDAHLRTVLRGLCLLHAPFLPEVAIAMFDPGMQETESAFSGIRKNLHRLWEQSLLGCQEIRLSDTQLRLYHLPPAARFHVEQIPISDNELNTLTERSGLAIATLLLGITQELDYRASATVLARHCYEDLERGARAFTGLPQAWYLHQWGWVLSRLGHPKRGLLLLEQALEIFQIMEERAGEAWSLLRMATGYEKLGECQPALALCQEALSMMQ